jgi:D-amino-acid dehydrogenase
MVTPSTGGHPRRVVVVGAGMVGLSTAWFLQDHGIDVTVIERGDVAAGASWGNAGWLTPGLTAPLPDPAVLAQGLRALLDPSSPVVVPRLPSLRLLRFLTGFARHSTRRRWRAGMSAYLLLNALALDAFDRLAQGGVTEPTRAADPFLACYRTPADRRFLLEELEQMASAGQDVRFDVVTGEEARHCEPALSTAVGAAIRIHGQRYVHPPRFMEALAASFRARGGTILTGRTVTRLRDRGSAAEVDDDTGATHRVDAVVVANGAELGELTRPFGVRRLVQAGRGYSFTVRARQLPSGPVYFPSQRIACTPLRSPTGDRLRVAGTMEFRSPSAPLDGERIEAMVAALAPLMDGLDLHDRQEEWVGSRPCTTDGLPLIGGTGSGRVFVAGGHGMWGIVLGPVTGQLLARLVATGRPHPALAPFDPTR